MFQITIMRAFLIAACVLIAVAGAATSVPIPTRPHRRNPVATVHTDYGIINLELFPSAAPKTVANFMNLSRTGFYNHTYFYRYVANFVIQGGGYYNNQTSNITVPLEYKLPNDAWTVGLARDNDPNSGSSEYYINLVNNSQNLAPGGVTPQGYCVFARVIGGGNVDAIKRMMALPTHYSPNDGTQMFNEPWPLVHYISITQP